jgi:hypothetical protein
MDLTKSQEDMTLAPFNKWYAVEIPNKYHPTFEAANKFTYLYDNYAFKLLAKLEEQFNFINGLSYCTRTSKDAALIKFEIGYDSSFYFINKDKLKTYVMNGFFEMSSSKTVWGFYIIREVEPNKFVWEYFSPYIKHERNQKLYWCPLMYLDKSEPLRPASLSNKPVNFLSSLLKDLSPQNITNIIPDKSKLFKLTSVSERMVKNNMKSTEDYDDGLNTGIPVYDMGLPYDCSKLIVATILGEPRLKYKTIADSNLSKSLVAYRDIEDGRTQDIFKVNTNGFYDIDQSDLDFGDDIINNVKSFTELKQFGRLFYMFGKVSLQFLAATLIKINYKGEREPISSGLETLLFQLNEAIKTSWTDFSILIGTYKNNKELNKEWDTSKILITFEQLYDRMMENHKNVEDDNNAWYEIGNVLADFYVALEALLLGTTFNFGSMAMFNIETLVSNEGMSKANSGRFVQSFIHNSQLIIESKQKFISLLLTFAKMTNFYEKHLGFDIKDPIITGIVDISKEFENFDSTELNEYVDTSILTQSDLKDYVITFESFLEPRNLIDSPAIYESGLLKHDVGNKIIIANAFYRHIKILYNHIDGNIKNAYLSLLSLTSADKYNEGYLESLYDYLMQMMDKIPNKCCPTYYHLISFIALTFRYMKYNNYGSNKDLLAAGIYLSEALQAFLFHEWFRNNKLYATSSSVKCTKTKAIELSWKAETYIIMDLKQSCAGFMSLFASKIPAYQAELQNETFRSFDLKGFYLGMEEYSQYIDISNRSYDGFTYTYDNMMANYRRYDETAFRNRIVPSTHLYYGDLFMSFTPEFINKYIESEKLERKDDIGITYDILYKELMTPIQFYSRLGSSSHTFGFAHAKEELYHSPNKQEILEFIMNMPEDDVSIPTPVNHTIAFMFSSNIKKIREGNFVSNKKDNLFITILWRILLPLGMCKESLYSQIDKPYYMDIVTNSKLNENVSYEMDYKNLMPYITSEKKWNFLDRRY